MAKNAGAGEYATVAEVEMALRDLSDVDAVRLDRVADFRARKLIGLGLGIEAKDLLQEAIMRTFAGERRWRRMKVSFVKHLCETMRSLASHACEGLHEAQVESGSVEESPRCSALTAKPCDSRELVAVREELAIIEARFADDDEVRRVLAGLAEDKKGPDIQRDLGISALRYAAIMTRLRRGLDHRSGGRS